jgi:hypothetical protein
MRWYKTCLLEGRSIVLCPEIQYPTGAPLGCFSPLHFQGLLYIPLSLLIANDVLCFNLLWMLGMVTTGLGTFLLAWHVARDRFSAAFGGVVAMLCAPMMLHAVAHLELIYLGAFPLFLWTWLRLVDQPSRARLAAAVGAYVLVAVCAAYYVIYAVFPAALYFLGKGLAAGRLGAWPWFRDRARWLLAFSALVIPCLGIIFGNHLWAMAQGYALPRSFAEFQELSAPLWSYACPVGMHALGRLYPSTWYADSGLANRVNECCSYVGVVTLLLVAYAAAFRVRFRQAWYWWACLVLLVVLAGGTGWTVAGFRITLPGLWLKRHFILFRTIRAPARFNLFVAVVAGVVASCGLKHLQARLPSRWMRGAVLAVVMVAAVADLAMVPYYRAEMPPLPGCYAFMQRAAPNAAFVEVPQYTSAGGSDLNAICAYWQSFHRGRTTAGYCGQGNAHVDNLLGFNSPFSADALAQPEFLEDPTRLPLALDGPVAFSDYAWLYLKAHDLRFVVVHQSPSLVSPSVGLDRLKAALAEAKVFEDAGSIIYDRDRLAPPQHPVLVTTGGWRIGWDGALRRVAELQAHLVVYNPEPARELRLAIVAKALHRPRQLRLVSAGRELSRWTVEPRSYQALASPTFRLPGGLSDLVLESDGTSQPRNPRDAALPNDLGRFSMRVGKLELESASDLARRSANGP